MVLMGLVVVLNSNVQERIVGYVLKTNSDNVKTEDVTFENTISSRQALIDNSLDEFKRKPIFGNGFQVDGQLVYDMGDKEGLILSAPIEKGVWITAVLQEGGVVGFIIYVCFVIAVAIRMKHLKYHCAFLMVIMLHVINLGEFTLFSMSGMGGFQWSMVFLGVVMDEMRLRGFQVNGGKLSSCASYG